MAKNIAFFADGTWNGPSDDEDGVLVATNVLKLFCNLSGFPSIEPLTLPNEQERITRDVKQHCPVGQIYSWRW